MTGNAPTGPTYGGFPADLGAVDEAEPFGQIRP